MRSINENNVSVYGLGYVGLTLSIVLAENNFNVFGIEKDYNKIISLRKGHVYLHEPNINSRFQSQYKKNFFISYENNNNSSSTHIICVGTPINKRTKKIILEPFKKILNSICKNIKKKDLIIIRSTVPIGFCRDFVIPTIEKKKNFKPGKDFYIAFAPERTIEGNALDELVLNPQIIGAYSEECLKKSTSFFETFCKSISIVDSIETAEMCKLVDNTFRDVSFGYSNEISILADKFSINVHNVIDACNRNYERNNIPKPSPGVGGPCLTKDPYIMSLSGNKKNYQTTMILSARKVHDKIIEHCVSKIKKNLSKKKKYNILFCGLAFKGHPETNDVRDSTTIDLIESLKKKIKCNINVHDFVVKETEIIKNGYKPYKITKKIENIDAIIISNNHKKYSVLDYNNIIQSKDKVLIFDCWRILKNHKFQENIKYIGVGF